VTSLSRVRQDGFVAPVRTRGCSPGSTTTAPARAYQKSIPSPAAQGAFETSASQWCWLMWGRAFRSAAAHNGRPISSSTATATGTTRCCAETKLDASGESPARQDRDQLRGERRVRGSRSSPERCAGALVPRTNVRLGGRAGGHPRAGPRSLRRGGGEETRRRAGPGGVVPAPRRRGATRRGEPRAATRQCRRFAAGDPRVFLGLPLAHLPRRGAAAESPAPGPRPGPAARQGLPRVARARRTARARARGEVVAGPAAGVRPC
jgi:hypothetical protein